MRRKVNLFSNHAHQYKQALFNIQLIVDRSISRLILPLLCLQNYHIIIMKYFFILPY